MSPAIQRERLAELSHNWARNLLREWDNSRQWLYHHGTSTEATVFRGISGVVVGSLLGSNSAAVSEAELSAVGRLFIAIHLALIRVVFFLIASFRLWVAVGLFSFARGLSAFKPYAKPDALGQMGNGRVFYSGAHATLEGVTPEGIPDKLIRGFACPQMSTPQEARASALWQVLVEYGVVTPTNTALAQIIVKNGETRPYVASAGDEEKLLAAFEGADLVTNTAALLKEALTLHSEYRAATGVDSEPHSLVSDALESYPRRVSVAMRRALTPRLQSILGTIPASEVATLVLAFESGKVLAHSFEGERWIRRSNFPHLCARAVLHSLREFPLEYDTNSRGRIRRALVYAARKSPFSQIRLPVDLDDATQALRQWAEVLLACPHELADVSSELELFALLRDANARWQQRFFDTSDEAFSLWQSGGFATSTDLLFLPVNSLVQVLREIVSPLALSRMRSLITAVAGSQQRMEAVHSGAEGAPPPTHSFDRVHSLPPTERIDALAEMHGIPLDVIGDWLVLKHVLSCFGWLASRVGDYTVPETSTIFAVFQTIPPRAGANVHGRVGKAGMVPLRGTKLREQLGTGWALHFSGVERVSIAERQLDFEKLLQGIEDKASPSEVEQGTLSPVDG